LTRIAAFTAVGCALATFAAADPVTYTQVGTTPDGLLPLSASATFNVIGDVLTITLTNTATYNPSTSELVPSQLLTGVFWSGTPTTLTTGTATITAGSLLQGSTCTPGPCTSATTNVGGEFRYQTGTFPFAVPGATAGIASSGYIGGVGNMGGSNLDNPDAVNGLNFGIAPTGFTSGSGNGGIDEEPIILGSVTFTLNGAAGINPATAIQNVYFTYGTSPEAVLPRVPEPATLTLLLCGTGLMGVGSIRRRRKKQ
jgi:hypothetical protein